jgi:tryptophan synthase alpha subunit
MNLNKQLKDKKDYLTLKFGNIKYADLNSKEGKRLFKEYCKTLEGGGLIMQDNNPKRKEIVCKIIDEANIDFVMNDWTGRKMSKERAKRYIMKYGDKNGK